MRLWIYALVVVIGCMLAGCQQDQEQAGVTVEAPVESNPIVSEANTIVSEANTLVGEANPIVGTWRLVSWVVEGEDGSFRQPYGEVPGGQIIYTSSGRMSAQLMKPGAELDNLDGLDATEAISRVAKTFFAYYGRYTVDEAAGTVTHHVEGCLAPTWVGTDQVRAFRFEDTDHLVLSARLDESTNVPGTNELLWKRIRVK